MFLDFRGNLRGPSGNCPDTKFMSILFIRFSVDKICTASVATRDSRNGTKKQFKSNLHFEGLRASAKYTTKK